MIDYPIIILLFQTCLYCMFVAVMAFFAKVSDPAVGGTYMTLLNTMSNLGTNLPITLALWAIDHLTFKQCTAPDLTDNTCSSKAEIDVSNTSILNYIIILIIAAAELYHINVNVYQRNNISIRPLFSLQTTAMQLVASISPSTETTTIALLQTQANINS